MNIKYIVIVQGEPYSIFSEIIAKFLSKRKIKHKIIIIGNLVLFKKQLKKLNYSLVLNSIDNYQEAIKMKINFINIDFKGKKIFSKISYDSKKFISKSFKLALKILNDANGEGVLINGPVAKKTFLRKKYLGVTEYLAKKTNSSNEVMLIYNDKISVSPLTTHIPLKNVAENISREKIIKNVVKLDNFFKKKLNKKIKFAVLGLNPHCESIDKFSEEDRIIIPAIKNLTKKNIKIEGPFSADTFFIKKNLDKFDLVIGMYHDQVLTPMKTLFKFDAINLTIGLPFVRISPDHGPNFEMSGKNLSDPSSLFCAMRFIDKLSL